MHPNPAFRQSSAARNLEFARERAFGVLIVSSAELLVSHVPFLLIEDGSTALLHLVRSNPIVRAAQEPVDAKLVVTGADGYVSPDWYEEADQVPTWNYVAVHLTGQLSLRPADDLQDVLDCQAAFFEAQLAPKKPWTSDKMDADALSRMKRMIVPAQFDVTSVDGTWKVNQNKSDTARRNAADAIQAGVGSELEALSNLMRNPEV